MFSRSIHWKSRLNEPRLKFELFEFHAKFHIHLLEYVLYVGVAASSQQIVHKK